MTMKRWTNSGVTNLNLPGGPYAPGDDFRADLPELQEQQLLAGGSIVPYVKPKPAAKPTTTTED